MATQKHIKIGELEVPADYWSLDIEDRKDLCAIIADAIITVLDKEVKPDVDRMYMLNRLLESSIETNEIDENYEVCQVLSDIKQIINE